MLSTLGVNLIAELKVRAQPPLSLISLYISRARRQYTPWGRTRILERRARASLNLNPSRDLVARGAFTYLYIFSLHE